MGFPKQEYWSGLPFLSPGALLDSGMEPTFLAVVGGFFTTEPTGKLKVSVMSELCLIVGRTESIDREL